MRHHHSRRRTILPIAESLEWRRMLDAVVDGRVLGIRGGKGNDTIVVDFGKTAATVTINGAVISLDVSNVNRIRIFLDAGNDKLMFDKATTSAMPATTLYGGAGNDTIDFAAYDGRLHMFLEAGDDSVTLERSAPSGPSTLFTSIYGADGNDALSGGLGRDLISGDAGNDGIAGNGRNDTLYGG